MIKGLHIRGNRSYRHTGFNFWFQEYKNGKTLIVKTDSIKTVEHDPYTLDGPDTTFSLPKEAAQVLLNDLWEAGYRPDDGAGNVGQLKATQSHLADMKEIVFHTLKINKEQK